MKYITYIILKEGGGLRMSINDEFELVPKGALRELKKEIELLKTSKSSSNTDTEELAKSVALLRKSVDSMYDLFKKASEEIKLEDRDQNLIEKKLEPLTTKIESMSEQNQKIAKALVTVSNMVQDNMKKLEESKVPESKFSMPEIPKPTDAAPVTPPPMGEPQSNMPVPPSANNAAPGISAPPLPKGGPQGNDGMSIPPPPPRKKGFF